MRGHAAQETPGRGLSALVNIHYSLAVVFASPAMMKVPEP